VADLPSGTLTIQRAIEIQRDLPALLASAEFQLSKWVSNKPQHLATIADQKASSLTRQCRWNLDTRNAMGPQA
jgi:hypothetical protein